MRMTNVLYIILTCFRWGRLPMFPHSYTMKHRLTYLYIGISLNFRITPNGSLLIFGGYAAKWAHPP